MDNENVAEWEYRDEFGSLFAGTKLRVLWGVPFTGEPCLSDTGELGKMLTTMWPVKSLFVAIHVNVDCAFTKQLNQFEDGCEFGNLYSTLSTLVGERFSLEQTNMLHSASDASHHETIGLLRQLFEFFFGKGITVWATVYVNL